MIMDILTATNKALSLLRYISAATIYRKHSSVKIILERVGDLGVGTTSSVIQTPSFPTIDQCPECMHGFTTKQPIGIQLEDIMATDWELEVIEPAMKVEVDGWNFSITPIDTTHVKMLNLDIKGALPVIFHVGELDETIYDRVRDFLVTLYRS